MLSDSTDVVFRSAIADMGAAVALDLATAPVTPDPVIAYNGSASPTTTVASSISQDIDGLLLGTRWTSLSQSYSFPTLGSQYGAYSHNSSGVVVDETTTFQALNSTMQTAARAAFGMVNDYTLLSLTENTTTPGNATIRLGRSDEAQPTAYAYYPSAAPQGGDIWLGTQTGSSVNTNPISGNYAWLTHLHEIGHSLGLKHSQETGGVSNVAVTPAHDAMEYTVMSYRSYVGDPLIGGYSNEATSYAQTYMMYDIAALQYMYGADFGTNSSNSVYTFSTTTGEMLINGVGQGAPGGNHVFRTVWDGGGIDTYDFSNYISNQTIDLTPGGYSLMSTTQQVYLGDGNYAHGNLYNALQYNGDLRSLIENANGGSGNDTITGNTANNILVGNDGNDILYGNDGNDYLYCGTGADNANGGAGVDVVLGEAGNDTLSGGADTDYIYTGSGTNTVYGDGGVDVLYSQGLNDVLYGGADGDYFYSLSGSVSPTAFGGLGNDIYVDNSGGAGTNDIVYGEAGNDYFYGFAGNDIFYGGEGVDVFLGGAGNDVFDGGTGTDYGWGGAGDNIYLTRPTNGYLVINDFKAGGVEDYVLLEGTAFTSFDQILGSLSYYAGIDTTILTIDQDTSVWLIGVKIGDLKSADFHFA
jgi:serralysin